MFNEICALPQYQHFIIAVMVQLLYFGFNVYVLKSKKIKAHSIEEATINKLKKWSSITEPDYIEEIKMEVTKGLLVDYKEGSLQLTYSNGPITGTVSVKAAAVLNPVLDGFQAKLESGEIDPIKGTDLDKTVLLQAIAYVRSEVNK